MTIRYFDVIEIHWVQPYNIEMYCVPCRHFDIYSLSSSSSRFIVHYKMDWRYNIEVCCVPCRLFWKQSNPLLIWILTCLCRRLKSIQRPSRRPKHDPTLVIRVTFDLAVVWELLNFISCFIESDGKLVTVLSRDVLPSALFMKVTANSLLNDLYNRNCYFIYICDIC